MMMSIAMALTLAAAGPADVCVTVTAALPQSGICVADAGGIALASDRREAQALLDAARTGAGRFRAVFGREPSRYAVFSFDDPSSAPATVATLRSLGFVAILPLPSAAGQERRMAEALREMRAPGGVAPRVVRRDAPAGTGEPRGGAEFVPHELGHRWYAAAFWPAPAPTGAAPVRRYGTPAPDWLDEAAAMMMEDDVGRQGYYQRFADGRSADPQRAAGIPPELPLTVLVGMEHPALAGIPASGTATGPLGVTVTGRPSLFYAEARIFADYLIERSGEPTILATISERLKTGATFETWLAQEGGRHRLQASSAAMQPDWEGWLDHRFGAAAR